MFVPDMLTELAEHDKPTEGEDGRTTSSEPAILIVDDDVSARGLATRSLKKLSMPILEAETGFEALHLLVQRPDVALIILDMVMPGQHGSKTFYEIRKQYPQIPVIVVTGFSIEEMRQRFKDDSPELMLSKPYQPSHLLEAATAFLADVGI